ncbi:glycosyltransferase [Aceticella autotrophica]|uniref:Glycosyltransferase n=1 Tax=Aceticella autotrophica TaxID=2755338 RepID=A0A975G952_9THEO|nr:glycosyltransferase [Aceticella autotrophica]QSZ26664.1 glycosyltransferase [Aceticella autotrophica]
MKVDSTFLTLILLFVGAYYLFLFFIALNHKEVRIKNCEEYFYFIIIPAKNEEKVIETTLKRCLKFNNNNYRIIVVDDNSNDLTPVIVNRLSQLDSKIILLNNLPNEYKKGKGNVLNYAYRQIMISLSSNFMKPFNLPDDFKTCFDDEHIIVGVFDADAKPSINMLDEISSVFSNFDVDAVQTAVRIYNRNQSLLAKMQDIEFLGFSRIIQKARSIFGSVGLGGNGQFSKLSSLNLIGLEPWGNTLTEDFELGLRMISKGMRLYFTDRAIVEQEGVVSLKALIRQRTRWLQGHFNNWKYIFHIIRSKSPIITKVDTLIYIIFVSVVFIVGFSLTLSLLSAFKVIFVENKMLEIFYNKNYLLGFIVLITYSFAFIPMFVYSIFEFYKDKGFFIKISYILLFAIYTYIWLPSGIAGLYRLATQKTEWIKTKRIATPISSLTEINEDSIYFIDEKRKAPRIEFHSFLFLNNKQVYYLENYSEYGARIIIPFTEKMTVEELSIDVPIIGNKKAKIVWEKEDTYTVTIGLKFVS